MTLPAPLVTIGMPVLDNARTLRRAIGSIQTQSLPDWRLIVSDDGSSDTTEALAAAAAALDPRITVLRQPARLGFMNFRVPLDLATTPYFAWLAGDDQWHPDFLALTVHALQAAPRAVSALPQAAFLTEPQRPVPNLDFLTGDAARRIQNYLKHPGGTRMYGLMPTDAVRRAFPPRGFHAYDWYLVLRLLAQGPQLSLPQTLLLREETPWWRYAEDHALQHPKGLRRAFPVAEMSWQILRDGGLPLAVFPALLRLNLLKHEEIVALTQPDRFQRRLRLYRALGLPIARSPARQARLAQLAQRHDPAPSSLPASPPPSGQPAMARAVPPADITAILTFRNAARTVGAAVDHLQSLGCRIVAIDHGSTDASRQIVQSRLGGSGPVQFEPWTGAFDLTRQLRLKRQLIEQAETGWILHADADEFLDPPPGADLARLIAEAEAAGHLAFPCTERLFLQQFEDEEHAPASFQTTLTASVAMEERDGKQRLFRRDANLGLWLTTGGHSITRDPARLSPKVLALRHYPGLSLDDLRGQYLARAFAPDDRARGWHGTRAAPQTFDVVEPDPVIFRRETPVTRLPVLAPRRTVPAPPLPEMADLLLLGDPKAAPVLPGLRVVPIDAAALPCLRRMIPVLHVVTHPAGLHGKGVQRSLERERAEAWVRRIAQARQWALDRHWAYLELRAEDLPHPDGVADRLARLWHPPLIRGAAGFLMPDARPVEAGPWLPPVRTITGPLAADLGYR